MGSKKKTRDKPGRPPTYETAEEMIKLIETYFKKCDKENRPYTVPGLARALGFTSRQSLINYAQKSEFVDTLKMAKLRIEEQRAEQLIQRQSGCAGLIFDLKNNFGWQDKVEVEQEVSAKTTCEHSYPMPPQPKDMVEWMEMVKDYNEALKKEKTAT